MNPETMVIKDHRVTKERREIKDLLVQQVKQGQTGLPETQDLPEVEDSEVKMDPVARLVIPVK